MLNFFLNSILFYIAATYIAFFHSKMFESIKHPF